MERLLAKTSDARRSVRGVVAEWLDPSTPDTTGNDVFLVAFNHLRNGSLAYVHYLLRCNDGYGLTELTQLERLRVSDLAQLKKRMVSKGAIPDEPLLRYVATFVCTGGLGVRARKFKDFSFDLCYFLELLKGGDWDTMPHYQALVEPFYSCRAGLGTTQTSEEVHAKLVGKVFDPDVVHDLRIMANKEAYMAHAGKTDEPLTAAIQAWFAHYDEQLPITGELYAASPNDKEFHSSSIVTVNKRPEMATFHWGGAGMLGPMPDMAKGDS